MSTLRIPLACLFLVSSLSCVDPLSLRNAVGDTRKFRGCRSTESETLLLRSTRSPRDSRVKRMFHDSLSHSDRVIVSGTLETYVGLSGRQANRETSPSHPDTIRKFGGWA